MSQDTTSRSQSEEPARPAPFVPCSDCRAPMTKHYYALDTRPVCPKCRAEYQRRIDFGKGKGSLARVIKGAGGVALLGALALGVVGWGAPILRVLAAVAVAWFLGKAVRKASGDYFMRRNQTVAYVLLWLSVGLAGAIPATWYAVSPGASARAAAEITPAQVEKAMETIASGDATPDEVQAAETVVRKANRPKLAPSLNESLGSQLREQGLVGGFFGIFVIMVTSPVSAIFSAGLYAAGVGLFMLGLAFYKLHEWTSDGVSYDVTGPFRVGSGPIPTTW